MPRAVNAAQILGTGVLGGIGFTVSIFIAELSFDDAQVVDEAKMGIFAASIIAGVVGYFVLRLTSRPEAEGT
jgi:NhaA family Na+:H+ antiporter